MPLGMFSSDYIGLHLIRLYTYSGYQSNRTGRDTSLYEMWATNGLLIYDHTTNTAKNISDPDDSSCYTYGAVHHIGPFPDHRGLLLILPSKIYGCSENFTEGVKGGRNVRNWNYSPFSSMPI